MDSLSLRVQAEQIAESYIPAPVGRPSKLVDADTVQLFLAAIRDGLGRESAARQAGIAKQTLYNWIKRADHDDEAAIAFVDALEKAESDVERRCSRNMLRAGDLPQFWAASATWLERKYPERWGKRNDDSSGPKVVVQIGGFTASEVSISTLSPVPQKDLPCGNQD